jgi:hypothetical protein
MVDLLSGIEPEPFCVSSKSIVTDESVTREEAEDDDGVTSGTEIDLKLFAEQVRNLKTTVRSIDKSCSESCF